MGRLNDDPLTVDVELLMGVFVLFKTSIGMVMEETTLIKFMTRDIIVCLPAFARQGKAKLWHVVFLLDWPSRLTVKWTRRLARGQDSCVKVSEKMMHETDVI